MYICICKAVNEAAVRKAVAENQLDAGQISGTGRGGRITKEDVVNHLTAPAAAPAAAAASAQRVNAPSTPTPPPPPRPTAPPPDRKSVV